MDKEEYKKYYSEVYRHSLAHILAKAVVEIFGRENVQYAIGPQISDGFYYDFLLPRNLTNDDFATIEDKMREILKRREDWTVEELSKDAALELFAGQKFKEELINDLPADEKIAVYRTGDDFVDLSYAREALTHFENAELIILPGAGHIFRGKDLTAAISHIEQYLKHIV